MYDVPEGVELPSNWNVLCTYERGNLINIYNNKRKLVELGLESHDLRYLIGKPPLNQTAEHVPKKKKLIDSLPSLYVKISPTPYKHVHPVPLPSVDDNVAPVVNAKEQSLNFRQEKREQEQMQYDTLWWKRPGRPHGLLLHPKSTKNSPTPLLMLDVPSSLLTVMEPKINELKREGIIEPLTQEQMYSYVSMQNSLVKGVRAFRGWQVQLSITGPNSHRVGVTWESQMGALMAAAALIDPRLQSTISATSWVMTLVEGGDNAAKRWINEVGKNVIESTMMIKSSNRNGGRRPGASLGGINAREEMIEMGYEHPVPRMLPLPEEEMVMEEETVVEENTMHKEMLIQLLDDGLTVRSLLERGFDIDTLCSVLPLREVLPYAPKHMLEASTIPSFLYRQYIS